MIYNASARAHGPVAEIDPIRHGDLRLVRTCEEPTCTLMFLDRTEAHARRWCSMAACGNRAKAAAHPARNLSALT